MINWKVRIKNKNFWITIVPAMLVLIQVTASIFGVALNLDEVGTKLIALVNAVFVVLAILGIVVDPTTSGIGDSERALGYDRPYKD